jgi:hypothetical protein
MRAYKFLARGATGTFSGVVWPAPGEWIDVEGSLDPGRNGVHVCRATDLAHWLNEELWAVDIDGEQVDGIDCVVVQRATLVRRIETWDADGARRFATACIDHAAVAGSELIDDARDALHHGYVAVAAYSAALAVARRAAEVESAYAAERAWQSSWIYRELIVAASNQTSSP